MDYQPIVPPSSDPAGAPSTQPPIGATAAEPTPSMLAGMASMAAPKKSASGIGIILVVLLAIGCIGFGMLAVTFYGQAQNATNTLNTQKAAAVAAAVKTQKTTDNASFTQQEESPYRSYNAPEADGSFVINFPKNWSSWVDEEQSGTNVTLVVNPDHVGMTNGINNFAAAEVRLIETDGTQYMQTFSGSVQGGTIKQANTSVSGVPGYVLTGAFNDNMGTVEEVVVPVRDKVLVFACQNAEYLPEFNEILAQAKIYP